MLFLLRDLAMYVCVAPCPVPRILDIFFSPRHILFFFFVNMHAHTDTIM